MAALLIVGLLVADIATYVSVRSFLFGRLDEQLDVAQYQAYTYLLTSQQHGHQPDARGLELRVSPDVYVLLLDRHGHPLISVPSGSATDPDPRPAIGANLPVQRVPNPRTFGRQGTYRPSDNTFEVGATGNHHQTQYRAEAVAVPQGTLLTAISVNPTEDTLALLFKIELGSSIAVVLALVVLGLWTIRRGLRPLEGMARTAGAIAGGQLGSRVHVSDERTEVGQLGTALNGMLAQIEAGFDEKAHTEARLRQFVADASHELRTPLTSIRGYAELLRKGGFADEDSRQRALLRVEQEAARMGGLVDDLLLLARIDRGRALTRNHVDLSAIARDVVEDARALDPGRRIELDASSPVIVVGDRDRLGQVALNLMRNALVHTPEGTAVEVATAVDGSKGVLMVSDHGPGLTPLQASRVFDRFFRADTARSRGGTGLGLAIVRAIAEALGGNASVESHPGAGAVFSVAIPRPTGAANAEAPATDQRRRADIAAANSPEREGRPRLTSDVTSSVPR
jgi:two-component system OmpR family sensor kinase